MTATAAQLLQPWTELKVPPTVAGIVPARLVSDSRELQAGDAFVAIPGGYNDGREYIEQAIDRGVSLVLAEVHSANDPAVIESGRKVPVIYLPDLSRLLSQVASVFYGQPTSGMHVFAVTGTNGKTTCSHLYAQLRSALDQPCGVIGTIGGGIYGGDIEATGFTTPDAITAQKVLAQIAQVGAQFVSLEASSHSLDQHRIAAVPIQTALFTNLSRDHLDYHGDMASYAASKWRLFESPQLKTAIINYDDAQGKQWLKQYRSSARLLTYSITSSDADVYVTDIVYRAAGVSAQLFTPWGSTEIVSPLIGTFNLSNLLGVMCALLAEGVALESLAKHSKNLQPVAGRMQRLPSVKGVAQVVVDYAHTPDGLEQALVSLRRHCAAKLWCVFGCGGDRDKGKRPQMGAIAERLADHLIITNDNPRSENAVEISADILSGLVDKRNAEVVLDRAQAINSAITRAGVKDLVLVAGKGHEDYQIIGAERLDFSDIVTCSHAMANKQVAQS